MDEISSECEGKKKKRGLRTKPEGIPDFQGIPEVQEFRNGQGKPWAIGQEENKVDVGRGDFLLLPITIKWKLSISFTKTSSNGVAFMDAYLEL